MKYEKPVYTKQFLKPNERQTSLLAFSELRSFIQEHKNRITEGIELNKIRHLSL